MVGSGRRLISIPVAGETAGISAAIGFDSTARAGSAVPSTTPRASDVSKFARVLQKLFTMSWLVAGAPAAIESTSEADRVSYIGAMSG